MNYFTDTQTSQRFVEILQKLGWDVRTAYEEGLGGKVIDCILLIRANQIKRTLITFDELRGESGTQISQELRTSGGKIVKIRGGADQLPYRALGKLLFHHEDWYPFLNTKDGVAVISDTQQDCKLFTPKEYHQTYHGTDAIQFEEYLTKRKGKGKQLRGHRKKTIPENQTSMFIHTNNRE